MTVSQTVSTIWCVDSPGWGGSEVNLGRVWQWLAVKGQSFIGNRDAGPELRALVRAHEMRSIEAPINSSARAMPQGVIQACRWLRLFPAGLFIVWGHHSDSHRWLALMLALAKRDYIVVEQLVPGSRDDIRRSRLTIPIKRLVARRARAVVLNGHSQVEHYQKVFGLENLSVAVIPNTRPVTAIWQRVTELRSNRGALRNSLGVRNCTMILCVGRLTGQKDQIALVSAMLKLERDAQLVLVGEGPDRTALDALAAHCPPGTIHFAGHQADPVPWLAAADLFVLPSLTEGLPGALIEAMAAELPCISTDIPGNRELIIHEQTGILVEPHSPPDLTKAIRRLIDDRSFASRLAAAALHHARQGYDEPIEALAWRQLLQVNGTTRDQIQADATSDDPRSEMT